MEVRIGGKDDLERVREKEIVIRNAMATARVKQSRDAASEWTYALIFATGRLIRSAPLVDRGQIVQELQDTLAVFVSSHP